MPSSEFLDSAIKWRRRRRVTGRPWSVTNSISASMATTCRRSATGAGICEHDVAPGYRVTDAEPGLNVLALNSGSSSLKFGLYRVGSSRTEMLLSGEAESIGDQKGKFYAQDSRENTLLSETVSVPSQREAIIRIGRFLADSKMPAPAAVGHR